MKRKINNQYYLNVDGETEKWYFEKLRELINNSNGKQKVSFDIKVNTKPTKFIKNLSIIEKTTVCQISDYESGSYEHTTNLKNLTEEMRLAEKSGKNVKFELYYSNLTFDLWIILHKSEAGFVHNRKNYLDLINKAYNKSFISMDAYKKEINFKNCLQQIELKDVFGAVRRAEKIMERNMENECSLTVSGKFKYYDVNPALRVGELVKNILVKCGINQ